MWNVECGMWNVECGMWNVEEVFAGSVWLSSCFKHLFYVLHSTFYIPSFRNTRHCTFEEVAVGGKNQKVPHVCPWYMAYLFDNPVRHLIHDPEKILGSYVKPGMTVLDIGCGMGFFSLGMARMVGPGGRVISLDLQTMMLKILEKRAINGGLSDRIETRLVGDGRFPVEIPVDFALCFWMVHEIQDQVLFLRELSQALKPGAYVLIAEPAMHHVKLEDLEKTIRIAEEEGFSVTERPRIRMSLSVVLKKIEN